MAYIQICPQTAKTTQFYTLSAQVDLPKDVPVPVALHQLLDGNTPKKTGAEIGISFDRIGDYNITVTFCFNQPEVSLALLFNTVIATWITKTWEPVQPYNGCYFQRFRGLMHVFTPTGGPLIVTAMQTSRLMHASIVIEYLH